MKKLFYSRFTKLIVFIVCLVVISCFVRDTGMVLNSNGFNTMLEEDFADSRFFRDKCIDATFTVSNAIDDIILNGDKSGLEGLDFDFVKYFISINGDTYSNYPMSSRSYMELDSFWVFEKSGEGYYDNSSYGRYYNSTFSEPYFTTEEYKPKDLKVYLGFSTDAFAEERESWQNEKDNVCNYLYRLLIYAGLLILSILYFTIAAGRRGRDNEIHLLFFDNVFAEIIAAVMLTVGITGCILSALLLMEGAYYTKFTRFDIYLLNLSIITTELTFAAELAMWLSLVRSFKAKKLFRRFIVFRSVSYIFGKIKGLLSAYSLTGLFGGILKAAARPFAGIYENVRRIVSSSIGRLVFVWVSVLSAAYTLCILLMFLSELEAFWLIGFPVVFILALRVSAKYLKDFEEVRKGISEIKGGNTAYKIPELKSRFFTAMAEDVNSIGEGMALSVEKSVRSERMKAELITNVSHDLKTPLTSVISFSKLLTEQKLLPEEANDYARIIYDKSLRLKNLTDDLFDISRIRSGNEVMNLEKIDLCLLIRQSMAEYERAAEGSGLEFIVDLPAEGAAVNADGKKLSRVFGNLIDNTIKYAMKNTRVYISVFRNENNVIFEIKNISALRIKKSAEEITGRFVRGDEARSTEGSGLGLAIAKSYAEANGGRFILTIDGDLFKVGIEFTAI